jgi:glyoxylase-like metal-dependent hydrolase (beta-lactamase superfamily II)
MDATNGVKEAARVSAPPVASSTLSVNIFTAPGKPMVGERPKPFGEALGFDPITSTLIFGENDAVLVDAMTTVAEAGALADWIALHNRNLETIYITHAHFDHFYGLSILLDRFPGARAIATPKTAKAMQMCFSPPVERLARRMFPGQVATNLAAPEPYEHDSFTLEGHELRIIEQGRIDGPDSTSLYVPSIGLIVAGDVVYNQCRMYVGDTTPESRRSWIAHLDPLAALNPTIVVAGHKKPGAPDSPSAIQDTKRYGAISLKHPSMQAPVHSAPKHAETADGAFCPLCLRGFEADPARVIWTIAARILCQVLLVIILRVIESRGIENLGSDYTFARRLKSDLVDTLGFLRLLTLLLVRYVDDGAILRPAVIALAHTLSRIVRLPEHAQELLIRNDFRVIHNPDDFGVARPAGAHLFIRRIGCVAPGIPDRSRIHAG